MIKKCTFFYRGHNREESFKNDQKLLLKKSLMVSNIKN